MYNIIGLPEYFKRETTQRKVSSAFLETEAYQQALSINTPILYVVGNKGTGKSTVLNKILLDNPSDVLLFYFKEKFKKIESKAKKSLSENPSAQPYLTYEIEWKNELWDEIVLHLYNDHLKKRGPIPVDKDEYLMLHYFIRGRNLPITLPFTSQIVDVIKKIRKVILPGGAGGEVDPLSGLDYAGSNGINLVKEHVAKILMEKPLFLMIDEIDKIDGWNSDVRFCLLGLIEAIDSVHREVYPYNSERYDLLIRIAIRGDMLFAACDEYVDEVKLNKIDIDNAWAETDLEELVAQQIRKHWGLHSGEVSRGKLLIEVFPPYLLLKWDKYMYTYFHLLSGGNPRFLFALLKMAMDGAIQKANILITTSPFSSVLVTPKDIENILKKYSIDSLSEQLNGKKFLLPGLEDLKLFIKNKEEFASKTKTISSEDFFESLFEYIQEDEDLLQKIKIWPRIDTPIEEKVPKVLYELNLIAYKKGSKLIYYPKEMPKAGIIIIHPWFQQALVDQKLTIKNDNPAIEELRYIKTELIRATDKVIELIGSTGSTSLPTNKDMQSGNLEEASYLTSNNIMYGIARLLWYLRRFPKLAIAYFDELPSEYRQKITTFLQVIDDTFVDISEILNTDIKKLHLLAILLNSSTEQTNVEQIVFEQEMLFPENQTIFIESTKNIISWIEALNSNQREKLTSQMDKVLASLRIKLAEIMLEPVAEAL